MTKINGEREYKNVMLRIEELLKVVGNGTPSADADFVELDLLSELAAEYEEEHYPVPKPTLAGMLKLRMFEMGLTQNDMADMLDMNQSRISEIIAGKSEPTLKQARTMVLKLHISPTVVLGL